MNSAEGAAPAPECSVEDLYEHAPCGQLATAPDRRIISVNETLVRWLGRSRDELIGTPFTDLLTVGSRIHFETHFAPLLHLTGELQGVAVDLIAAGSARLPALIAANVKTDTGGAPATIRFVLQDASDRRAYERELLAERERAEQERTRATALARTLKRSLLPPALSPPAGLEACAHLHAASHDEVGGDFYDLFALAPGRSAFFLGDSCGKGISAATVASLTRYTLRAAAVFDDDPVAVLHNLDTVLINEFVADRSHFCTVIYGVLARHNGGSTCIWPAVVIHRRFCFAPTAVSTRSPPRAVRPSASSPTPGSPRRVCTSAPVTPWCCTPTGSPRPGSEAAQNDSTTMTR